MNQVSTFSMIAMAISAILCFGVPIVLAIFMRAKEKASFQSMFWGAITFIVSAMVLEQLLHTVVLTFTGTLLTGNIFLYAIYGGLAAGVFEETGRFFTMKVVMKNRLNKKEAVMYGVGHGGIEAILIGGMNCISNLMISMQINQGDVVGLTAVGDAAMQAQLEQSLMQLTMLPAWQFLLAGMERVSAIILHICLSYIVYKAVKNHNLKLYGLAILIHALVNAVTVVAAAYLPVLLIEIVLMAVMIYMVLNVRKSYLEE